MYVNNNKDGVTSEFLKGATWGLRERKGWREIYKENFLLNFPPSLPFTQPPGGTFKNSLVMPSLSCVHIHSLSSD